jgi:hypothetical protein
MIEFCGVRKRVVMYVACERLGKTATGHRTQIPTNDNLDSHSAYYSQTRSHYRDGILSTVNDCLVSMDGPESESEPHYLLFLSIPRARVILYRDGRRTGLPSPKTLHLRYTCMGASDSVWLAQSPHPSLFPSPSSLRRPNNFIAAPNQI